MLDARQLEQPLTEQERLLRDHFVAEYLKDFNAYQATIRIGFQASFAVEWARRLFEDGYVQRKIQHMTRTQTVEDAEAKKLVENELLRIAQCGSDTARVSAIREYNAMKGWSKPDGPSEGAEVLIDVFRDLAQQLPT
jgi:phage terminase small subunit